MESNREYLLSGIDTAASKDLLFYDRMVREGLTLELISTIELFVKADYIYSEPDSDGWRKHALSSNKLIDRSVKTIYVPKEVFDKFVKFYSQVGIYIPLTIAENEIFIGSYTIRINRFYDVCMGRYSSITKYIFRKYLLIMDCETFDIHSFNFATCD